MMDDIQYKGARFYKCALQVNPWTYADKYQSVKHNLKEDKYNQEVLKRCQENNIKVVGLADHGNIESTESLRQVLRKNGISVFPGFEIASSEKIHMVCLYPEDTDKGILDGYLAQLMEDNFRRLKDDKTHPSSLSCEAIAKLILNSQKGFWYAAHMTGKNGLLRLSGHGDNFKHLWKNDSLVIVGQIPGTVEDLDINKNDIKKYREIIENKNPDYKRTRPIAIINAKDVATPEDLADQSASCLIKMTEPRMESFRNAFYDPESRIKLNQNESEVHHTRIQAVKLEGGRLYKDSELGLSYNLNVIIGGHGTGKSTLIESLRHVLDKEPNTNLKKTYENLCKNNLADSRISIVVYSHAQGQNKYTISRRYGEPADVYDKNEEISALSVHEILPNIEIYSQSEILEIAKDNNTQIELLGRFLPDQYEKKENIKEIQRRLKKNREKLRASLEEKDQLESHQNQIPQLKEQIRQLKKLGIDEKLKNIGLLEKENTIIIKSQQEIEQAIEWLNGYDSLFGLDFFADSQFQQLPNHQFLNEIKAVLEGLKDRYSKAYIELKKETDKSGRKIVSKKEQWQIAKTRLADELNSIINELPNQGGKSGQQIAKEYRDLQRKLATIEGQSNSFKNSKNLVDQLEAERNKLLNDYRDKSFSRSQELRTTIDKLNQESLKGRLQIEFLPAGDKSALKEFLVSLPGIGDKKIEWIEKADTIFPTSLAQYIKNKDKDKLLEKYSSYGLTDGIADRLISMEEHTRLELEEVEMEDRIVIKLNVKHTQDNSPDFQELDNLSTGQKCIAILNILLLSNVDPLIMDQPEDNLDNAFIADRIVKDLRIQKNHRQFIFATHNANIPVFGDAELIGVLQTQERKAVIDKVGSIDKSAVQESAAQILEGGEAAFIMRKQKYGF